jgi:hypothetical protein
MAVLIKARWPLLVGALLCGASFLLPLVYPAAQYWPIRPEALMLLVPPLQFAGAEGMRRHLAANGVGAKWAVRLGIAAAIAWALALAVGTVGAAMGPGAIVLGILVLLPAIAIGLISQLVAFVLFMNAEQKSGS